PNVFLRICPVSSEDPSSTTTISISVKVWTSTLVIAFCTFLARLYVGITTDTLGFMAVASSGPGVCRVANTTRFARSRLLISINGFAIGVEEDAPGSCPGKIRRRFETGRTEFCKQGPILVQHCDLLRQRIDIRHFVHQPGLHVAA